MVGDSLSQLCFLKRRKISPDLVVDSAFPNRDSSSALILTESITTVCNFKLFVMNDIAALRSL